MQTSEEIRKKLVQVIGNILCRSIEEARNIPYILGQDEMIEILVRNPALFQKLVEDEQVDRSDFSAGTLTAKFDALTEMSQFETLDSFDISFYGRCEREADLAPALEQINQLTRTFAVYLGNTVTMFEKEFEIFTGKFRRSLARTGMELQTVEFTEADLVELQDCAENFLISGHLLRAFVFERLLTCHVITKEVVSLPPGYSLRSNLIERACRNERLFPALARFVLRACYVSQGGWEDLVTVLVKAVDGQPGTRRSTLIDLIEQDAIFTCNLLCETFTDLKRRTAPDRRAAIDKSLDGWKERAARV